MPTRQGPMFVRVVSNLVFNHSRTILWATMVLFLLAIPLAMNTSVTWNLSILMPQNDKAMEKLARVTTRVGGMGLVAGVVEGKDSETLKAFANQLSARLNLAGEHLVREGKSPYLRYLEYRLPVEFFKDRHLLYLSPAELRDVQDRLKRRLEQEKIKRNPFYVSLDDELDDDVDLDFPELHAKYATEYLTEHRISKDGKILGMVFKPTRPYTDTKFASNMLSWIRTQADAVLAEEGFSGVTFYLGGRYTEQARWLLQSKQSIGNWFLFVFVAVSCAALLFLRKVRLLFLSWLGVGLTVVFSQAFAFLLYGNLNFLTLFCIPVLVGLSMMFGFHQFYAYLSARSAHLEPQDALRLTLRQAGKPIWYGGLMMAAGGFTYELMGLKAFGQFGVLLSVGALIVLLINLIILPSLLLFWESRSMMVVRQLGPSPAGLSFSIPLRRIILVGMVLVAVAGGWQLFSSLLCFSQRELGPGGVCQNQQGSCCKPTLEFEYDLSKLRLGDQESRLVRKKFRKVVPLPLEPLLAITRNRQEALMLDELAEDRFRKSESSVVQDVRTIYMFLPTHQDVKLGILKSIDRLSKDEVLENLPKESRERIENMRYLLHPKPITLYQLPLSLLRAFSDLPPGTQELPALLKQVMGDYPEDGPQEEWLVQARFGLRKLPTDELDHYLQGLAPLPSSTSIIPASPFTREKADREKKVQWLSQALKRFSDEHIGTVAYIYPKGNPLHIKTTIALANELNLLEINGHKPDLAGETMLLAKALNVMETNGGWVLSFSLVAAGLLLLIFLRNLWDVIWVTLPLVAGLFWVVFLLSLTEIRLSYFHMLIVPALMGIGLTNSLFLYFRFKAHKQAHLLEPLLRQSVPVIISSLSAIVGFLAMAISVHWGTAAVGWLAGATVIAITLATLLLLPASMEELPLWWRNNGDK